MNKANQHIRNQAAKWFARMQHATIEHPDCSKFDAWLMQNPTHAHEYANISAAWEDFDSTTKLASLAEAMQHKKLAQQQKRKNLASIANKLAGIALLIFMGFFGFNEWQAQPQMHIAKSTEIGQTIEQELNDGSKFNLNANSEIEITYYRDKRLVKLKRGEAVFEVAANAERPFIVYSETARITVLGTRFLVNHINQRVLVGVDHGKVKVEAINTAGNRIFAPIMLTNGQMAEVQPNTAPQLLTRNALDAFSFTQGKLSFEDASLTEVAETLSRYRAMPVVAINTTGKPQAHITAILNIADTENFIHHLPKITAVNIHQTKTQTQLISTK